jgi:hypothetical protein
MPGMKILITLFILISLSALVHGQYLVSGEYDDGLRLAFDSSTRTITGYFEAYTGWDQHTQDHRFSCVFYLEGVASGKKCTVRTYYPADKKADLIVGTLGIISSTKINILLPGEHGGCWNVQHFADAPVDFLLTKRQNWIQIRYVDTAKAYFYADRADDKKLKSYLLKGDVVFISMVEQDWAYCTFFGKRISEGWLRLTELNKL